MPDAVRLEFFPEVVLSRHLPDGRPSRSEIVLPRPRAFNSGAILDGADGALRAVGALVIGRIELPGLWRSVAAAEAG